LRTDDFALDAVNDVDRTFLVTNNGLRHLAINSIRKLLDGSEVAGFRRFNQRPGNLSQASLIIVLHPCKLEPKRIAKRLFLPATAVCVACHFKIRIRLELFSIRTNGEPSFCGMAFQELAGRYVLLRPAPF
jgi:hypothetical protein